MYKLNLPAWAFDYNASYGTASNVPNASRFSPSYTYYNMNSSIYKNQFSAFIQNAQAGVVGQGISFYGQLNSSIINDAGILANHKEATHVWSMAIPITMACPIGLFTMNVNAGVYCPPNYDTIGPCATSNFVWYVDTDHMLKIGTTAKNGAYAPPTLVHNFGVDMTPYMYTPVVNNMDQYSGHRYAIRYSNDAYELFVDNASTVLATADRNVFASGAVAIINNATYSSWMSINGGGVYNYSYIGPGAYMRSNASISFNVYGQGNVYTSDWYGWETSLNDDALQAVFEFNWRAKKAAKTSSSYGAMQYCNYLTDVTIPGSMKNVGKNLLYGCNNLTSVVFSEGVENISQYTIYSSNTVNIALPSTIKTISSDGFNCNMPVVPTISYNTPIYERMFKGLETDYPFNRHEKLVELTYSNPLKQPKPLRLKPAYVSVSTVQVCYNMQSDPITYNTAVHNAQLVFNTNVNKAVHTNLCTYVASNVSNEGFDVLARSIEFPDLTALTHCTFIDDAGFICTYAYGFATVTGHTTGEYSIVPNCFDSTYLVKGINNLNANYPDNDIIIECPNELAQSATVNYTEKGLPSIYQSFNDFQHNITIKNAYYVWAGDSFNNMSGTLTFENCRYISLYSYPNNAPEPVFINCPNISINASNNAASTLSNVVINNALMLSCFDTLFNMSLSNALLYDIEVNYWRGYANDSYLLRCKEDGMFTNNSANNYVHKANIYANKATVNSITIHSYFGTVNSRGFWYPKNLTAVTIDNSVVSTANVDSTSVGGYIVGQANEISLININATLRVLDNAQVVSTSSGPTVNLQPCNYYADALGVAINCNIDTVKMAVYNNPTIYPTAVSLCWCNINSVVLQHNEVPSYAFQGCNIVDVINPHDCLLVGPHSFYNCNTISMQNIVKGTIMPYSYAFYNCNIIEGSLELNIAGNQKASFAFSRIKGPTHVTINMLDEVYGPRDFLFSSYKRQSTIETVTFSGKAIPNNAFNYCDALTSVAIHGTCVRIGTFPNATNLVSIGGLQNCSFITARAFVGTNLQAITLNPHTYVGADAIPENTTVMYYSNCPVGLNITNNHTATNLQVNMYDELKPLLKVNVVYEDGTEVATDDFYVEPALATLMGARKNCFVYAGGVVKQAKLPYASVNITKALNSTNVTVLSNNSISATVLNNSNGAAYIYTSNNNAIVSSIVSNIPMHTLTVAGGIKQVINNIPICQNNCRTFIFCNLKTATAAQSLMCLNWTSLEYSKWMMGFGTINMNVGGYYNCSSLSVVDVDTSAGRCILPQNFIFNCGMLTQLYLPNGTAQRFICSNAVRNCPSLAIIDFSGLKNANIVIYNNAFVNCYGLNHIDLPSGVKNICAGAFNRTGIKAVNVPTGCVVGTNAFPSDCVITYI